MLPGFANIGMYPKVFEAMGVSSPELVDRHICHPLALWIRAIAAQSGDV